MTGFGYDHDEAWATNFELFKIFTGSSRVPISYTFYACYVDFYIQYRSFERLVDLLTKDVKIFPFWHPLVCVHAGG